MTDAAEEKPGIPAEYILQVSKAINEILDSGFARSELVAVLADRVQEDWCGAKQTWPTRKKRIEAVLAEIEAMGRVHTRTRT